MRGKTIFITGGNTGIGFATAKAFATAGMNVAILSLGKDQNECAKAEIEALGVGCLALTGDVTIERVVAAAVDEVVSTFGGLDYAFNNAGVGSPMQMIEDQSEAEFDHLMNIDVKGVWLSLKYEIPAIIRSGGGAIVNSSSAAGSRAYISKPCIAPLNTPWSA